MREPNFENLLAVLRRGVPSRPTLFEFFLNGRLYETLVGPLPSARPTAEEWLRWSVSAWVAAGYDYMTIHGSNFNFPKGEQTKIATRSLNEGSVIHDRASFEAYPWPDPDTADYSGLEILEQLLPAGMKLIVYGPDGVLENVISLVGYEDLCVMTYEDPELVEDLFREVGTRMARYYEICVQYPAVGAIISNDDWGFKTQTMLSPADMRKYVFPWHKRIVEIGHAAGMPVLLHSCGELSSVMDDIIDGIGYDGKHSSEDAILPVEEAYERWGSRIAILGGIDVDFLVRATPEEITTRSRAMLERAATRGGYALGSGNSIPEYIPDDHYLAMTRAALEATPTPR